MAGWLTKRLGYGLWGTIDTDAPNSPPQVSTTNVLTQAIAYNGTLQEYIGETVPGTAKSAVGWRIKKLTYSGSSITDVQWADGVSTFTKIWDDRATYTYS